MIGGGIRIAIAGDRSLNLADVFQPLIQKAMSDPDFAHMIGMQQLDLNIARIAVVNGACQFSDQSLPLPFSTQVHEIHGNISEIYPEQPAGLRSIILRTTNLLE